MPANPIASPSATAKPVLETSDGAHRPSGASDVGGVPTSLDHGLLDQADQAANKPLDTHWPAAEAAAKADRDPAHPAQPAAERREPGHIDSALESIGEAISEPVRDAARSDSTVPTRPGEEKPA